MKRAMVIFIAVLAVMLVSSTTDLSAKSPQNNSDSPNVITPHTPYVPDNPAGSGDGEGEGGDADGVSGLKGGGAATGVAGFSGDPRFKSIAKVLWHLYWVGLYY